VRSRLMLIGVLMLGVALASLTVAAPQARQPGKNAAVGQKTGPVKPPTTDAEKIKSLAPTAVSSKASIVQFDAKGAMTVLRKGTNGWTCMPDAPDTPGPDPMCFDANAAKWADAWVHHKPPPDGTVGVMYMLEGGTDASNTDPYAKQPTADNDWIKTGPHIMLVGSKAMLAGYPSGAKPDTSTPYVMWAGTPYAHLMVPVNK